VIETTQRANPKVLIVAHEFPPIGGVGVQRPYKFTQYLPDFGWDPVILTQDARYSATWDESLLAWLKEQQIPIYRAHNPLMRVQSWLHQRRQAQTQAAPTTSSDLTVATRGSGFKRWLRGSTGRQVRRMRQALLLPDEAILWLPAAVSAGMKAIREHGITAIYATSPPESTQLVAALLSDRTGLPLIADFRDPWIGNLHRKGSGARHVIESDLESFVFSRATRVSTVTESFKSAFAARYPQYAHKLQVIPNGFDSRDLGIPQKSTNRDQMIVYYGGILYEKRSPETFLRALAQMLAQDGQARHKIKVRFAGVFDYPGKTANQDLIASLSLDDVVEIIGYVPHARHAQLMAQSDLLLVIGDQTPGAAAYVPAKVYEYLGVGKPILGVIQQGEASRLILDCAAGQVAEPGDVDGTAALLRDFYKRFQQGDLAEWQHHPLAASYERREQARVLADLLREMTAVRQSLVQSTVHQDATVGR